MKVQQQLPREMIPAATRQCAGPCGLKRAERFFVSPKGRICVDCQRRKRKASTHGARVLATYGITPEEYTGLLAMQGGQCAICKGKRTYRLNVDHDHKLESAGLPPRQCVRGLLCRRCNGDLLTAAMDEPAVLRAAADYLEHPPAVTFGLRTEAA